jgi:hypothetical protein
LGVRNDNLDFAVKGPALSQKTRPGRATLGSRDEGEGGPVPKLSHRKVREGWGTSVCSVPALNHQRYTGPPEMLATRQCASPRLEKRETWATPELCTSRRVCNPGREIRATRPISFLEGLNSQMPPYACTKTPKGGDRR